MGELLVQRLSADDRTWPVELDAGQTLIVESTLLVPEPDGYAETFLGHGPCKMPGGGLAAGRGTTRVEHAAIAPTNFYMRLIGNHAQFTIRIVGPAVVSPPACESADAIDVSLGSPFVFGSFDSTGPALPMPSNARFAHGSSSCTGIRHMGPDRLWRVTLAAGQTLRASADNLASLGPDPMAFYVVPDCADLSMCNASRHTDSGAAVSYIAPRDETVYLVLDLFDIEDLAPRWVQVEVLP